MDLLAAVTPHLPPRHRIVLMAACRDGATASATQGAPEGADAEIGSVSKGLTGLLLHDAMARGEVTLATTLGEGLGLTGALAPVTLGELATHSSGAPAQPKGMGERPLLRRTWRWKRYGENPYGDTVAELLAQAEATPLGKPRFRYSNLGFELLGAALAARAGTTYAGLLAERMAAPLALTGTYVPASSSQLRATALLGATPRGRAQQAWTGEAIGPAGAVRMTAADLATLLRALVDGSAPGIGALNPVAEMGRGARIGAAWITLEMKGRPVTWHNGRTGGFAAWLGVDRAAGTGVALVSATASSLDRAGVAALESVRA